MNISYELKMSFSSILVYRFYGGLNDDICNINNFNNDELNDSRWIAIDLSLVVSLFHLKVAIHHALMNEKKGKLKTKKIHSDVKYYLSGSSKYNEAIKDYSINNDSNFIAVIFLNDESNNNIDNNNDDEINNMSKILDRLGGVRVDNNEIDNSYKDNNDKDKIDIMLKVSLIIFQL